MFACDVQEGRGLLGLSGALLDGALEAPVPGRHGLHRLYGFID